MKIEKTRTQFEERYPIPSGMRWEPTLGPQGDYIFDCSGCCSGDRAAQYIARWEAWQASRALLRIVNPFPPEMGDPDSLWAREMAYNALRAQGFEVIG